jgi:hypothetical protein
VTVSEFFKDYGFVVGALSGSLAAYLLGLLVTHLRREKRWLGWAVNGRRIVSSERPDITISFKGQPIAALDSHTVTLRNIGNRPLTDLPVRIIADREARILEQETKAPAGIHITTTFYSDHELHLIIDLLNPKEGVSVDLTVSDAQSRQLQVLARIPGLSLVELNEISARDIFAIFLEVLSRAVGLR